jgi:IPT/TIG domain
MIRKLCGLASVTLLLGMAAHAAAQTPTPVGSITIGGSEGYSGGVWDTGVTTATINGVSVHVAYGQYSTPASIAAAMGGLISSNCNFPVFAHAVGTVVLFYPKAGQSVTSSSFTSVSNDPSAFSSPSFAFQQGPNGPFANAPVIAPPLSLSQGPAGMGFTINGANFGPNDAAPNTYVELNGTIMNTISWSNTSIIVQVPTGATTGNVVVTVGGVPSQGVPFTVVPPFGCAFQ